VNLFTANRRRFVVVTGLLSLSTAIGQIDVASSANAAPGKALPKPVMYEWESPAEGFNTKTYFYDTGSEVVASILNSPRLRQKPLLRFFARRPSGQLRMP
jgi:hypothetical protein